jgi:hypothetical protein
MAQDHCLPRFNFNVEEWDAKGQTYETLAICRIGAVAPRATFARRLAQRLSDDHAALAPIACPWEPRVVGEPYGRLTWQKLLAVACAARCVTAPM